MTDPFAIPTECEPVAPSLQPRDGFTLEAEEIRGSLLKPHHYRLRRSSSHLSVRWGSLWAFLPSACSDWPAFQLAIGCSISLTGIGR